jgi:hypothetical protein
VLLGARRTPLQVLAHSWDSLVGIMAEKLVLDIYVEQLEACRAKEQRVKLARGGFTFRPAARSAVSQASASVSRSGGVVARP